jgi:hypothetical protein
MDTKYAFYSTSKGYRVLGGTAAHFLKADGSLDNKEYIDKYSGQNIEGAKWFRTAGGNQYLNHRLRIISDDGSNPGMVFYKSGINVGTIQYDGPNYLFTTSDTNAFSYLVSAGYIKEGSNDDYALLGGGGHKPISDFVLSTQLGNYVTSNTTQTIDSTKTIGHQNTIYSGWERSSVANPQMGPFSLLNLALQGAYPLYGDEEFRNGTNGIGVYNNYGNGNVTMTREASSNLPNRSGMQLRFNYNGNGATPGLGGFILGFNARSNAVFIQKFMAKLPVGYSFYNAENYMGDNASVTWLTSRAGTGKWETYVRAVMCGTGTSFGNGGHVYVGGPDTAVEYYLAFAEIYEVNSSVFSRIKEVFVTQSDLDTQLGNYATLNGIQTFTNTNIFLQSPVIPNGTIGTHAVNRSQIELSTNPETEGGQQLNISGNNSVTLTNYFVTSRDGSRNPDDIAPNSTPKRVRFDFANSTSAGLGATGNYAGIMTFAPWDGTKASTGDSSYQLAFANQTGSNGSGIPMLKIRKGIDEKWGKSWYKFWTDGDFNNTNIQQWNYAYQYGLKLNVEFTTNLNTGLMLADNHLGGESGMIDNQQKAFVAGKMGEYYKYGSGVYGGLEGINFHWKEKNIGIGGDSDSENKVRVEGCVKALGNFKSKDENPDTIFIPNGRTASLIDEIINDESEYAIRLDPHEYEVGFSGSLVVDDRNRLIHVIGEQIKMTVDFKRVYAKQQIVVYNFDQNGGTMAVKVEGKLIASLSARCFLRLYVTKSLRVIAERQQPCEFVW